MTTRGTALVFIVALSCVALSIIVHAQGDTGQAFNRHDVVAVSNPPTLRALHEDVREPVSGLGSDLAVGGREAVDPHGRTVSHVTDETTNRALWRHYLTVMTDA